MNWKYNVTAIPMALVLAGVIDGCTQRSSKQVTTVPGERQEDSSSQKEQIEEARQAFMEYQQLFRKRDIAGIVSAHDISLICQRLSGDPGEVLQAVRKQYENYSDRIFAIIADAEIESVEVAPEEVRSAYTEEDTNLYLVYAEESLWLFYRTDDGWKTLGSRFEGEIAEELRRLDEGRLSDARVTVDVRELFSFDAPPETKEKPVQGVDSLVGVYQIGDIELHYDYGSYSSPLTEFDRYDGYMREEVVIDGWAAELVTTDTGNMGVVFPKVPSGAKLTLYARFKKLESSEIVREILLSIKFT